MATLNLVLVEPEIPQNTGNVARTCAATGTRLHLDITYYENIDDFFEKTKGGKYFFFSTKGTHRHSDVEYPDTAIFFLAKKQKACPRSF